MRVLTDRLDLQPLTADDTDDVYTIMSDPAVWRHRPDLVHTERSVTAEWVARAAARWASDGLSYWLARTRDSGAVLGIGGVQRQITRNWNLHYRLAPSAWRHGFATELSRAGIESAHAADSSVPVIAWIAENNPASIRVAERVGLHFRGVFHDPSDGTLRRAYSDQPLTTAQLSGPE